MNFNFRSLYSALSILPLMSASLFLLLSLTCPTIASASRNSPNNPIQLKKALHGSAVSLDATPPIGTPLAGYGAPTRRTFPWNTDFYHPNSKFFKPSRGVMDPIQSKVFLLDNGEDRLIFIGLDIIGVSPFLYNTLVKKLESKGYKKESIFISATHTHSGPGGLSKSFIWEAIATDQFNTEIFNFFTSKIIASVELAEKSLEPITLLSTSGKLDGFQKNRMKSKDKKDVDSSLNFLIAQNSHGKFLGGLLNYAIHGTALNSRILLISGDIPAAMATQVEETLWRRNNFSTVRPSILYINSAEGDIAPAIDKKLGIKGTAKAFASLADPMMDTLQKIKGEWKTEQSLVFAGTAKIRMKSCSKPGKKIISKISSAINIRLKSIPQKLLINTLKIDDLSLMTFPGEPTSSLGRMMKNLAIKAGARNAWVMGLTNGHYAYFTTPSEYEFNEYESCMSLFGKYGGARIADGHWPVLQKQY